MANPLAAFRKYQKTLLLIAAVGAMFAFGILPTVSQFQRSRSGPGGPGTDDSVVVSWNGGELRESDLHNQRVIRAQLQAFQQAVVQQTFQRGSQPRKIVVPDSVAEDSIVQSILLAKEAERLGIFVNNEAVSQHLSQELANDTIDGNELALILKQTTRLTDIQLFDALRMELAANQVQVLANGGAYTGDVTDTALTPSESFDYFQRLYRRMEAEVVALPVADFVDQVTAEPTQEEISRLYEKYKDTLPSPVLPTPGFKEPMRVAFQWLKADFQTFLQREKEKLTDEEIKNYYEENKTSYRKISLPTSDDLRDVPSFDDIQPDGRIDEVKPDGELEENKTLENDAVDEVKPATPESTSESAPTPNADGGAEPDVNDLTPPSLSHQDEDADSAENQVAGELSEDVIAQKEEAGIPEAVVEEQTGSDTTTPPATQPDAIATPTKSAQDAQQPDASLDAGNSAAETSTPPATDANAATVAAPDIEYYPLEEVRDDIANILARPRATEAITSAIDAANGTLKTYFDDYVYWETTPAEDRKDQQPPIPPDLKALASQLGVVSGETPLITMYEADQYELGNAFDINYGTGQRLSFVMLGFSPNLTKYNPQKISSGMDVDSKFVFWKVDEKESYTPDLAEAKPAVVRHLKMKKAIDLAMKKGEELIAKAQAGEQSLQGAFGEDDSVKVEDTGEFTWMTFGATPTGQGAPRLGFVAGVEYAGDDFMRATCSLAPGQFTVAKNYPESTVYVVYMKAVTADQEDLRKLFLNEGLKLPLIQIARRENALTASDWYKAFEEELELKWNRPPTQNFSR